MDRTNKKEEVAALHRERILTAAERLFAQKGYAGTTMADLCAEAGYSRRTVYAYYESKEDLLHHMMQNALGALLEELKTAVCREGGFAAQFGEVCRAMARFWRSCPASARLVQDTPEQKLETAAPSQTLGRILALGSAVNALLADWLQAGKDAGQVRPQVLPQVEVGILWAQLEGLFTLEQTKGDFLARQAGLSREEWLAYGLGQLLFSLQGAPDADG